MRKIQKGQKYTFHLLNYFLKLYDLVLTQLHSGLQYKQQQLMGQANATPRQIHLTIETSENQSLQLFDYKSQQNRITTQGVIQSNGVIIQDGDQLVYQLKQYVDSCLYTFRVHEKQLELQSWEESDKVLWRVLKQGELYPLSKGTEIKLGKVRLRLKRIVYENDKTQKEQLKQSLSQHSQEVKSMDGLSNTTQQKHCRICFQPQVDSEDPLLSLCKCSGSVKYRHYSCLKDWVTHKIIVKEHNNTLSISYEKTYCEICKQIYQPQFYHKGKLLKLLNFSKTPNPPYAHFEVIEGQEENKKFTVYMIGLNDQEIVIGRNSNSSVVMKEISISRSHCALTYKQQTLFIRDNNSKFGTLIKVDKDLQFSPTMGLSLQYESKLLTIQEKSKLSCCCVEDDSYLLKVTRNSNIKTTAPFPSKE